MDIAKESADLILLEKSLLVLEAGVVEGRKVFANILKYVRMGASSNFGNMFSVVGASVFVPFLPMAPIQILVGSKELDLRIACDFAASLRDEALTFDLWWASEYLDPPYNCYCGVLRLCETSL